MTAARPGPGGLLVGWAGRLRFPQLFILTAVLFLIDLVVPDLIPLADEVLLGLLTLLLGTWKRRRKAGPESGGPVIDVTPED